MIDDLHGLILPAVPLRGKGGSALSLKKGPPSPTLKGMAEGKGIERLMEIMARLRGEGGCPWD
ncbi:MAG: hypothetical protein DRG55_04735, partial [Deltaproteobacteria bacterium]